MGGKSFLLSFEDEDLFIMLEDLNWSYLKDIFQSIKVWSEKSRSLDRATWIEIRGVSLHAWNMITLKRIAAVWGNFEAWGENHNMTLDAEKTSVLITTSYAGRINEIIQVEVDNDSFEVGSEDSSDTSSTSERFPSSRRKENNFDSGRLMERAAILEKEVNLEGADKQFEENEEVKEYHCEVEKAGCDHHVEVGGRSCIDADKGIAKKSWAEGEKTLSQDYWASMQVRK
ncbi:hypothetical protein V6N13_106484 [Hibiscus sabdariffa]